MLIDCPPALGLLTVNALVAADYALLSAEAQYFALQGVEQALEVIELAEDSLNPDLEWLGVMLNIADMRTRHSREAFDSLREHFGEKLLDTTIRSSIAYAESAERAVSILDYRPDLAVDYLNVADELLQPPRLRTARDAAAPSWSRTPQPPPDDYSAAHVGALALERRPHHRRPALRPRARAPRPRRRSARSGDHTSTVGPAPEIVAPSAPSQGARTLEQLRRARVQARAVGLVQPVAQPCARSAPSPRRARPSTSVAGARDVEHGVGERHLMRAARPAPRAVRDRLVRDDQHRLEAQRRVEAVHALRPCR